jgi:hypothetical protein
LADTRATGGKKGRKIGRSQAKCSRYKAKGRREENKARRQKKHQTRMEYFAKRRAKRDQATLEAA